MAEIDIRLEQRVAASPARVWEALIRPGLWWSEVVELDPEIGGSFHEPWWDARGAHHTRGRIVDLDPPHLLKMTWKDEDWSFETHVMIGISALADGSLLTLRHSGWETAPADRQSALISDHRSGWPLHLKNLAVCAECMPPG